MARSARSRAQNPMIPVALVCVALLALPFIEHAASFGFEGLTGTPSPPSYLFRPGTSIRLALAGADRDHFALIPSEGPPTWTVLRDAAHPSHVALPVVPR